MALFPGLESLDHDPVLWPGALTGAEGQALKVRLESLLAALPDDVRSAVLAAIIDPQRNVWARTLVYGLVLAESLGCRATGVLDEDRLAMVDASGSPFALGIMGVPVAPERCGRDEDIAELVRALESTFGNRRYVLYLRQPLPSGFDSAPIARAVHLWLGAIDRGEWHGQHAIYEDNDIALELILTGEIADEGCPSRLFTVPPITALERLADVDSQLVERAGTHDETHGDMPLIFVLGSDGPWRLPRGYVQQLLYGTSDWVKTVNQDGNTSYLAAFSPNGRSLFSDPACVRLGALWWVEPTAEGPMSFRSWAHQNPWSDPDDAGPLVGSRRFQVVDREADGGRGKISVVLAWTEGPAPK